MEGIRLNKCALCNTLKTDVCSAFYTDSIFGNTFQEFPMCPRLNTME